MYLFSSYKPIYGGVQSEDTMPRNGVASLFCCGPEWVTKNIRRVDAFYASSQISYFLRIFCNINNMLPRTPLGEINGNRRKSKNLTSFQIGQILGCRTIGETPTKIAKALEIPRSTVSTVFSRSDNNQLITPPNRFGRPKILSER